MTREAKIMVAVFVLIFGGLGFLIVHNNKVATTPVSKDRLILSTSHNRTSPNAKVNLVEFGDFQCPACAQAYPIVEQLLEQYKDNPDVNFVFRNFPLPQHQYAPLASEVAEAAGAQGKYWQMFDLLYSKQNDWVPSSDPMTLFTQYAQQIGLNLNQFKSEVQANKYSNIISKDQQDGLALGINATPTFFLNGTRMEGVQNFADFKARVDAELAK